MALGLEVLARKEAWRNELRSPYPGPLRACVYKYGLQGKNARWVNEHWDDPVYFPFVERNRPDNFDRTLRRWLKGQGIPQSEKDEVILKDLRDRHQIPQAVIEQMMDVSAASDEGPRLPPEATYQVRVRLWQDYREQVETSEIPESGETLVRYGLFIFGSRTVEDFSSKLYALFEQFSPSEPVGWVMFDYELRKIVGLILP